MAQGRVKATCTAEMDGPDPPGGLRPVAVELNGNNSAEELNINVLTTSRTYIRVYTQNRL